MVERAASIAQRVAAGHLRAVDAAAAALARVEERCDLNAIVSVDRQRTLAEAETVDRRVAQGHRLPLAGVPVAIKDLIWVEGRRVTQGSRLFSNFVAPQDAAVVARLKAAGAVVIGMANTSEFGCKGVTTNPLHGPTTHPQDKALTPGGSSGGCASAVAGGLVPVAIGTDSGGSSRRPAAHVGCVGFKPTPGAVPAGPGFPALGPAIDSLCPMTHDVADADLVFRAMAGIDDARPPRPATRLAFSPGFGMDIPIDPEIAEMMQAAVATLCAHGLTVETASPQWPQGADPAALMPLQHAGLARLYGADFARDPAVFDPDIAVQIDAGLALDNKTVAAAQALSAAIRQALDAFLRGYDAILSPTAPCFAWPHAALGPSQIAGLAVGPRAHAALTPFANHGGNPAISLPLGKGAGGLPAGLHVCGRRGEDLAVLDLAARIEAALSTPRQQRSAHR